MKTQKPNLELVWKQFEDLLAPRLRMSPTDRAVYSHLFRHSRLVGRRRFRFSMVWLAGGVGISHHSARRAVRRLIARGGVLRLVERNKAGHLLEVRLPGEIPAVRAAKIPSLPLNRTRASDFEDLDYLKHPALRQAIHARERGRCFYCLSRLTALTRCLDHVIPQVELEDNSYRNLVSCCQPCNSKKGDRPAEDHLRQLQRKRRLSDVEFADRLRALDALVAGKLRPALPNQGTYRREGT